MKIRYEVVLDEPLMIDGDWPLELSDGGLFRVKTEAGKAIAFEVEYSGKPSDHFRREDGVLHLDDDRWTRMRPFFARLKSFIQMESEANFDPTEVFAHYDGETEAEKQDIPMHKVVLTKGDDRRSRRPLDHELLGAAVLASYSGDVEPPPFISELKSMSRRSEREGRYVDSFRYSFLIVDTLYGQGKFRTNQLVEALSSSEDLSNALEAARRVVRQRTEDATEDTAKILASDATTKDLMRHIVKRRGEYFHGTTALKKTGDWRSEEARTLCNLMGRTTDEICRATIVRIFGDDTWDWYESSGRRHGKTADVAMDFGIRERKSGRAGVLTKHAEFVGERESARVRLKWALQSLEGLELSDEENELESIVCKEMTTDQELFTIRMTTTTKVLGGSSAEAWNDVRAPSGAYELVWCFDEEDERATLQISDPADTGSFWFGGPGARWLVGYSLRQGLEFVHGGLYRIACRGAGASASLFEVRLGDL